MIEDVEGRKSALQLVEIGPRFVLNPLKIVSGSFEGPVIFKNNSWIDPKVVSLQSIVAHSITEKQEHKVGACKCSNEEMDQPKAATVEGTAIIIQRRV